MDILLEFIIESLDFEHLNLIIVSKILYSITFFQSALVLKRAATASTSPSSRASKIFSSVSCFGGGGLLFAVISDSNVLLFIVFLATCLMHLLPESMEQIEKAESLTGWETKFPFAELCISLGFIFVLSVEQVCLWLFEGS